MMLIYFIALSFAILAIGISGMVTSRNFLRIMLSVQVAMMAPAMLATAFFYYTSSGDIAVYLLGIWCSAAMMAMTFVVAYKYLVKFGIGMDITAMSNLKD